LDYLRSIEEKLEASQAGELNLISKRSERGLLFPYRERYLEYIVNLKDNSDNAERYQTMLAELYIDNLFKIQERSITNDILVPELIDPTRQKLQQLLD
jgi:hypothetical protein